MLSRVAERTYWLARYLERAENTARLINVYSALLLDLPASTGLGWDRVLEITGCDGSFGAGSGAQEERAMLEFLLYDAANPSALLNSLRQARENARTTRDLVPSEGWRAINELYLYAGGHLRESVHPRQRTPTMQDIVARVQRITGLLAGTMSHGPAYQFLRLGRNLERADMSTRMIDVAAAVLLTERPELAHHDKTLWMAILRCLSAYQMYRQSVRRRVFGPDVIEFLLKDQAFPRALAHCLIEVHWALAELPRAREAMARLDATRARLDGLEPGRLDHEALHGLIDELQREIAAVHDGVAMTWFHPADAA